MTRRSALLFLLAFAGAVALAAATTARAYHRFWAYCNYATAQETAGLTRDGAMSYSNVARYEGYQWGGGCWNNDDDSTYGDPTRDLSTHGEGGDCSGLVFKTWRESTSTWDGRTYYWAPMRNVHGPYASGDFMNPWGAPNATVYKPYATTMDAFANYDHIGMVFFRETSGADQIVEAKGEYYGTNIWTRTYRSDPSYGGARRIGWTG
jgi:hypothetical protein